jgi:hypothetical protein
MGRHSSTVDLLPLTIFDQLLLGLKTLFTFLQKNGKVNRTEPSASVNVPWVWYEHQLTALLVGVCLFMLNVYDKKAFLSGGKPKKLLPRRAKKNQHPYFYFKKERKSGATTLTRMAFSTV